MTQRSFSDVRPSALPTHSSITTRFPAPGDRVRSAIDGLGEVALEATRT